jgi:hypothetical protein
VGSRFCKIDELNTVNLDSIDSIRLEKSEKGHYGKIAPDRIIIRISGEMTVICFDSFELAKEAKDKLERRMFDVGTKKS